MRFEVSRVLDAIEARLSLDPALARAVVDLAELVRLVDLDGDVTRPASLLRLGHVLDALGRHLAEDGVAVYVVVARPLLSDLDLSSNERMVIRRWADDGLVEVLAAETAVGSGAEQPAERVLEVAGLLGVPVLSRRTFPEYADRHPWLPRGLLAPAAAGVSTVAEGLPGPAETPVLTRMWRCPELGCAGFGVPSGAQPPPHLLAAAPTCPRHGTRLADAGPRPPARVLALRVDGAVRGRFVVREAAPVLVGRAPGGGPGSVVALGPLLGEVAMRWISRSHLRLELRGQALVVTDTSTNGTSVRTPAGPVPLHTGQAYGLGPDDVVELHQGVELGRPTRFRGGTAQPASVMAEAPTVSIRLPR